MAVWSFENAAHLLRRTGFGGTRQQVQDFYDKHASVAEAVDEVLSFSPSKKKPPKGGRDFYRGQRKQKEWWIKTMMKTSTPKEAMREKMVLFWHGHLCSGLSKQPYVGYTAIQNGLFREYSKGNFKNLIREFNRDPANLWYLDGIQNWASNDGHHVTANENFGREVMELFTLGISQFAVDGTNDPLKPNYTEVDVHQLARALTGWVDIDKNVGIWRDYAWDGGKYDDGGGTDHPGDPVVLFGVTNNNYKIGSLDDMPAPADDVLEAIFGKVDDAGNRQVAMFLSRKLWTCFAYPAPAPGLKALLAGFAATFVAGNWELEPLLRAMLNHDEFYSDRAKTRTVKSPVDYMVGLTKTLGVSCKGRNVGDSAELQDLLEDMGQQLFEPPNVAGWPGGKRWVTTGTLVTRLEFARNLAESDGGTSPLVLSTIVPIGSATTDPAAVVDAIIRRLGLDGSDAATYQGGIALTSAQRAAVLNFITDSGNKTTLDLSDAFTNDAKYYVRGAIALVLQSAEAQIF
jgi:uncharacterized protein (DUF1800 family)